MQIEDTGTGVDGTYLENVYASAKTTFQASDILDDGSDWASGTIAADDAYVGAGSLDNGDLKINGVDIGAVEFSEKDATGSLTTAINAKSDITGVTASISDSGELVLTAADGRDIVVDVADGDDTDTLFAGGTDTDLSGTAAGTFRVSGQVTITAMDTLTLSDGASGSFGVGNAGSDLDENNVQAVGTIANADVTTVEGANNLINSVDSALKQVDGMRAKLGAVQNRFESTINNLTNISENVSASRSRTLDADFASETANLTKSQILQQAGVAMLSQANQLPQQALSLLQG
jgi:flagellin